MRVYTGRLYGLFAFCFALQEGKRKFDKETTKYSQSLDRYLNMKQNKSNESQLLEVYSVSQKKNPPPRGPDIFSFFSQTVENL